MSNSTNLTTQKQQPRFSVAIQTKTYQSMIANTLRDPDRQKRFVASITSAVAVNPALQECEASTILAGALLGESLNLSPSPQLGQYYLVPFKQKEKRNRQGELISPETTKATFVLGYKGYIQLALRSGSYKDLDVMEIKQGEFKGKDPRTGRPMFEFMSDEEAWEKAPTIGYMAFFEYLNGFTKMLYWPKAKMLRYADKYSPAFSSMAYQRLLNGEIPDKDMWKFSGFWYKDFDMMAKKTMLRQLISKWGLMSTEMVKAMDDDGSVSDFANNEIITTPQSAIPLEPPVNTDVITDLNLSDI
mgnify:CR=1 FL=1